MEINISAALTIDEAELLELELLGIANELAIEAIDVARIEYEGDDLIRSIDIFYDDDKPDDRQLRKFAEQIIEQYGILQSRGSSQTREFRAVAARVGPIQFEFE